MYSLLDIDDSIFKLMIFFEKVILLKNQIDCNFMLTIISQFHSYNSLKLQISVSTYLGQVAFQFIWSNQTNQSSLGVFSLVNVFANSLKLLYENVRFYIPVTSNEIVN